MRTDASFAQNCMADSDYLVPNPEEHKKLLYEVHAFDHYGHHAMIHKFYEYGIKWNNMQKDCSEYVKARITCQRVNIAKKGYHPLRAIHATLPGEHLAIDLAVGLEPSNRNDVHILIIVDVCTRFVFLYALKDKTAADVVRCLFDLFCIIGLPNIVQSDNEGEFSNKLLQEVLSKIKVEHHLCTPYHPRSNGVAERSVQDVKNMLRKMVQENPTDWDRHLPAVQLQINARASSLHNSSPFSLFFGRPFYRPGDHSGAESNLLTDEDLKTRLRYLTQLVYPAISEKSKERQDKMVAKFKKTHKLVDFPNGTMVMARDERVDGTTAPKYEGPAMVGDRYHDNSYILLDGTGSPLTRRYAPSQLKMFGSFGSMTFAADKEQIWTQRLQLSLMRLKPFSIMNKTRRTLICITAMCVGRAMVRSTTIELLFQTLTIFN